MRLRYAPYHALDGRPHVVVDGAPTDGTVLTLSHWPRSGTPAPLRRDLSAESAFAYLDRPDLHVDAEIVTNNHLDEDGLVGVFALVDPEAATARRDRLVEVARAGDFAATTDRAAARVAFALASLIGDGARYEDLLDRLPVLVDDIDGCRHLWEDEDELLAASLDRPFDVEELPDLDCSIVRVDGDGPLHPVAVHNAARGTTVCTLAPGRPAVEQRYEGWVQLQSRRPRARRDLRPLATTLSGADSTEWVAGGPSDLVPECTPVGPSTLPPDEVAAALVEHLRAAPAAFDPYDPD
jgi:hypothetical protein